MGYDGVTHGGILFCLLDDVMANYLFLKGITCFTAKAEVRYRAPLPVNVPVALEGRLVKRKGRLAVIEGKVLRQDTGAVVTESTASFMVQA
jgi:acyl-coenzyme A thioesterase PaaI-like protein